MRQVQNKHRHQTGRIGQRTVLIVLLVWIVAVSALFSQRQALADYVALKGYTPSSEIAKLATDTAMNDDARRVFYVNKPLIVSGQGFRDKCPGSLREQTIVLGCYHSNQRGIYLLGVEDKRLYGVVEVTAAHEMLHAYYDRLSSLDKSQVDAMLLDYYDNQLTDQRIIDTIDSYRQTVPDELINEMHSIFGTEVAELSADLEQYYSRYFTDRQAVVSFANKYEAEFSSRRAQIANLDGRLAALKQDIESLEKQLQDEQQQISNRRAELERRQSQGDIEGFNAGVAGYNNMIIGYNADVQRAKSLVEQYNQLVAERNEIASEISELSEALNSSVDKIRN